MGKRQYHYARKTRQLKYLCKQLLKHVKADQETGAGPSTIMVIERIKRLISSGMALTWTVRKQLALITGFIGLAAAPVSAQFLLAQPVDESFNLWESNTDIDSLIIVNSYFVDADDDGDMDAFYTAVDYHYYAPLYIQYFFQENISTPDLIRFDEAVAIIPDSTEILPGNALSYNWSYALADMDEDGDLDFYIGIIDYYSDSLMYYIAINENTSSMPNEFDFTATQTFPILQGRTDYLSLENQLQFGDLDGDGDKDLLVPVNYYSDDLDFYALSFLYYENNGDGSIMPYDTGTIVNPFSLDMVSQNMVLEGQVGNVYGTQLIDVDDDGDQDLIFTAYNQRDEPVGYNYYEYSSYYFENTGTDSSMFSGVPNIIHEYPIDWDSSGSYFLTYASFVDIDGDRDLDGMPRFVSGASGMTDNTFISSSHFQENLAGEANFVSGKVFMDTDQNGEFDVTDYPLADREVFLNGGESIVQTNSAGVYQYYVRNGSYNLSTQPPDAWVSVPDSYNYNFFGTPDTIEADFAWQPQVIQRDLRIDGVGGATRFGFDANYTLILTNEGTTVESGSVHADFDDRLTYVSANPAPDNIDGSNLRWDFTDLLPLEERRTSIRMNVSTTATAFGDTLCSVFYVDPYDGDLSRTNNSDTLCQIVTGSYDPNDKLVQPLGTTSDGIVPPETDLFTYTIRFQNTGNDTAFRVIILDELDEHFDLSTFEMVASSHPYILEIDTNRVAAWTFSDILLPDSNVNVEGSNGYLQYDIRPLADMPIGTQFTNEADIYFDYNDPVRTNQTLNTFAIPLGLGIRQLLEFNLYPNPTAENAILEFKNETRSKAILEVYDLNGILVLLDESYGEAFELDGRDLSAGTYTFRLNVNGLEGAGKLIFIE